MLRLKGKIMESELKSFTGKSASEYKIELAKLRIEVFREYPYLYDGTTEYEEKYLERIMKDDESIIVVAFREQEIIGISTGMPLKNQASEIQEAWIKEGFNPGEIYYFSESVLKKEYRGMGTGKKFFLEREKWAKELGYKAAVFCAVIRQENHPDKPEKYFPLNVFWEKRGFKKQEGLKCKMSWKEIKETEESEKELQFWHKYL